MQRYPKKTVRLEKGTESEIEYYAASRIFYFDGIAQKVKFISTEKFGLGK